MRKRGLLALSILGVLLLSLGFVSAGPLGEAIDMLGMDLVIVAVFLIIYLIVFFALSRVLKDKETGKVKPLIPGGVALGVALLVVKGINQFNLDISTSVSDFAFSSGISGETFEIIAGVITLIAIIALLIWLKSMTLLIAGILLFILGGFGGTEVSLALIIVGIALIILYVIFAIRGRKEELGPEDIALEPKEKGKLPTGVILFLLGLISMGIWVFGLGGKIGLLLGVFFFALWFIRLFIKNWAKMRKWRVRKWSRYGYRKGRKGVKGAWKRRRGIGKLLLLLLIGVGLLAFGLWAGTVWGIVAGIVLIIFFIWLYIRMKKREKAAEISPTPAASAETQERIKAEKAFKKQIKTGKAEKILSKIGQGDIKSITYRANKGEDVTEMYQRLRERYLNEVRKGPSKRYKDLATEILNLLDQFYDQWKGKLQKKASGQIETLRIAYQELYNENKAIVARAGGKIPPKGSEANKQIGNNRKEMKKIEKQIDASPYITLYEFSKMIYK
jgi:hypothetical protein